MSGDYIDIGYQRLCNCKQGYLSCIEPREWMKNQIGVWTFKYEARDIRDKNVHPSVFPIEMAKRVIEQFTHKGELVLDPFVGSGTTLLAAQDLERNAVGFDLKEEYIELSKSRLVNVPEGTKCKQLAICDDAINVVNYIRPGTVKLAFTSPPYANILNRERKNKSRRGDLRENEQFGKVEQYSQNPRDLGTMNADAFEMAIKEIFEKMKPVFSDKAHILINITDAWIDGKRVPLHINIINAMIAAGYEFRNTIIWDRRNLVNKIGIFGWPSSYITMGTTFEYILDFIIPAQPKKNKREIREKMKSVSQGNLVTEEKKMYKLLGADGQFYESETPGQLGGNSKLKVYGKLDCGSAKSTMKRFPGKYEEHRVFFADEKTALEAGYRPCGNCMRAQYREYMADPEKYREKIGREAKEIGGNPDET